MMNAEKYREEILEIANRGHIIALVGGKVIDCTEANCTDCYFDIALGDRGNGCQSNMLRWLFAEETASVQDILEYLDTVLHPIVASEHWDVYSELHDMVSSLTKEE